jgi:beta-lactamase class A
MGGIRMSRRRLATALALVALGSVLTGCSSLPVPTPSQTSPSTVTPTAVADHAAFSRLENEYGAELGVYGIDTGSGRTVAFDADARFAFASTYKALAGAVLLSNDADLGTIVSYTATDLVAGSPDTSENVATGMTLGAVAAAAIEHSDNTAGNLLLDRLGGPVGLQAALRAVGDAVTDVDRTEPALNSAVPGDIRDTSTPRAFALDLARFAVGQGLSAHERTTLAGWLRQSTTGATLVRAAVPAGWTVGDKSGAASYGTRNDIAVIWPPDRQPIVLAIFSHRETQDATYDDALIADAARVAIPLLAGSAAADIRGSRQG